MAFSAILVYLLGVSFIYASRYPYYNTESRPSKYSPRWMKDLDNNTVLSRLSIPGTHQTLSFYGGDAVQCQSWSLLDQYKAGIRFVDIRCILYQNRLYIYHDTIYQRTDLETTLRETQRFLQDNPTETILMRIRNEDPFRPTNSTETFTQVFRKTLDLFPASLVWRRYYMPELRRLRGKIVLLREFPSSSMLGIFYHGLKIKDDWYVASLFSSRISAKWEGVKAHLEKARHDPSSSTYLSYTSGNGLWAYPYSVAFRVNYLCLGYLKQFSKGRLGIIAMDFPGEQLIENVLNKNHFISNSRFP